MLTVLYLSPSMKQKVNHSKLIRDISWLSFNARVLQEANDPAVPLLERLKFLGIYSSNLDEFFRVRVATIKRLLKYKEKAKKLLQEKIFFSRKSKIRN